MVSTRTPRPRAPRLGVALALLAPPLALLLALALAGAARAASTPVAVYPEAGTHYNLPATQIAFRGVPADHIGAIRVVGSKTGVHTGHIAPDSDGAGGSFIPDKPFASGETVTVTTSLPVIGASNGTFSFAIATPAGAIPSGSLPLAAAGSNGVQHFASRPDLEPPAITVTKDAAPASEGDIFIAPQFGPAQNGPMILDPQGNVVYFKPFPVSQNLLITDFRPQELDGQPVLTWFQGDTNAGYGQGEGIILNQEYRQIATVKAANGLQMDLHEFLVTNQGDAYIFATSPVWLPGISRPVLDNVVQEIDIATGLVLFEWHALDHVPLSASYVAIPTATGHPWDPYHSNSISLVGNGDLVVSMRNTSAVYAVDRGSGQVLWVVGGKQSSFHMGAGTSTWGQHDVEMQPDGTLTIFDDGAGPPQVHPYSRGIHESLDFANATTTLLGEYDHAPDLSADFEGSMQLLAGGDVFLGWGQQPYFSEDDSAGQEIFDAHFNAATSSYRAYRFPWNAQPPSLPALAVTPNADGSTDLYASWNGATDVTSWQVLAGSSPTSLAVIGGAAKSGFETRILAHSSAPYFAVQAIGTSGQVLVTSHVIPTPVHIAIYGGSAFVAPGSGVGGLPVSCFANHPCHMVTSVTIGRSVLARSGTESMAAGGSGVIYFQLSPSARAMLTRARDHRLPVRFTVVDVSGTEATSVLNLIPFYTGRASLPRRAHNAATLRIVGLTAFVARGWTGGILTGCEAATPCHVSTTVSAGRTVIARSGSEFLGTNELGYLLFTLTAAGHDLLARASGNELPVTVQMSNGAARASAQMVLVGFS